MSDAKERLRALAGNVRTKLDPSGEHLVHQKGLGLVEEIARELGGAMAMPGLTVLRPAVEKAKLLRSGKNAEIVVSWERPIGALELTSRALGKERTFRRYVWDGGTSVWRRMEGVGELWEDLQAELLAVLYPDVR
jgi:hypothetical protein